MKRLSILLALAAFVWIGAIRASTLDCTGDATFNGNLQTNISGYMYCSVWMGASHDTTYVADTAKYIFDTYGVKRLVVQYKWTLRNAFCASSAFDSVKTRIAYIWSNDGSNWFRLDSSAAITDLNWHSDTLIVRPYKMLKVMSYPSRDNFVCADSTGHPITETNLIPDNAYYRRCQWYFTPFYR